MHELLTLLQEIRPEFDFRESSDFIGDGMLDSLDIVTLVSAIDKQFAISIAGTDIVPENFRSLATIAQMIQRHGGRP